MSNGGYRPPIPVALYSIRAVAIFAYDSGQLISSVNAVDMVLHGFSTDEGGSFPSQIKWRLRALLKQACKRLVNDELFAIEIVNHNRGCDIAMRCIYREVDDGKPIGSRFVSIYVDIDGKVYQREFATPDHVRKRAIRAWFAARNHGSERYAAQ